MIADFAACYVIEMVLKHLFSDFRPKDIAVRRPDQVQAEEARIASEAAAAEEAAEGGAGDVKEAEKKALKS